MGRNKGGKNGDPLLKVQVNTRFTEEEWAKVEFVCSALGIQKATFLRDAAVEKSKRGRRIIEDIELSDTVQINLKAIATLKNKSVSDLINPVLLKYIEEERKESVRTINIKFAEILGCCSLELKELQEKFDR
jgi:fructose-1,6-bisphosphatase/sedoheptulose 1,7-bisphosphatase-like protein